jgi:hypothetical protein
VQLPTGQGDSNPDIIYLHVEALKAYGDDMNASMRKQHILDGCVFWGARPIVITSELLELAFAARVTAVAGDLQRILVLFAVGAAVVFICHATTGRMGAFLLVGHGTLLVRWMPSLGWMPVCQKRRFSRIECGHPIQV